MYILYSLILIIISQLSMSIYNYSRIKDDGENTTGNDKADIAKKITLAQLVLSIIFTIFILILYYTSLINVKRAEFLCLVSIFIISILMILSYYYLNLQLKSKKNYEDAENTFKSNWVRTNLEELQISLYGGIITISLAFMFTMLFLSRYFLAETKIITIREPVYRDTKTTTLRNDYIEPDYMSNVSKNFII